MAVRWKNGLEHKIVKKFRTKPHHLGEVSPKWGGVFQLFSICYYFNCSLIYISFLLYSNLLIF